MKISEKQLLMLLDIAKDTCSVADLIGGYDPQTRVQLVNDIINQQSDEPKEVEPDTGLKLSDLEANEYGLIFKKRFPPS